VRESEVRDLLWDRVHLAGSQKKVAEELDISPQYLNDVLASRRDISYELAKRLGYYRIVTFQKVKP